MYFSVLYLEWLHMQNMSAHLTVEYLAQIGFTILFYIILTFENHVLQQKKQI